MGSDPKDKVIQVEPSLPPRPDILARARELFHEYKGNIQARTLANRLFHEGYQKMAARDIKMLMPKWAGEDPHIPYTQDSRPSKSQRRQVIKATNRTTTLLKELDREIDDKDIEAVRETFHGLLDVSQAITSEIARRLPSLEIKTAHDIRVLVEAMKDLADTAANLRDYSVNAYSEKAKPIPIGVGAEKYNPAINGEVLPPVRNNVQMDDAFSQFTQRHATKQ